MKKYLLPLMVMSLLSLGAEEKIGSIDINGLVRTKNETVLRILKIRTGDSWQDGLEERLEQRLRQAGIFQNEIDIQVLKDSEMVDLEITLQDKWTLIAIPFFTISQGKPSGGAFAVDSNAFGRKHLIVASGSYASDSNGLFLLYSIPNIQGSSFTYLQTLVYGEEEVLLTDLSGETELGRFKRLNRGSTLRLAYDFNDRFTLGISSGLLARTISDVAGLDQKNINGWVLPVGLRYQWADTYLFPLFSKGITATGDSSYNVSPQSGFFIQSADLTLSSVPAEWVQMQLYGTFFYTDGSTADGRFLGKSRSSLSLPDEQIAASMQISGDAALEFRIVKLSFGNITVPLFYEGGIFNAPDGEGQFYQGAGGGIRLYVDKVAIPAMGLEYHQSLSGAGGNITFSIGAGF